MTTAATTERPPAVRRGRPRKGEAGLAVPPCALCGTGAGALHTGGRPRRYNGAPFGVDGALCAACYRPLWDADRDDPEPTGAWRLRLDRRVALFLAIRRRARAGLPIWGARREIGGAP